MTTGVSSAGVSGLIQLSTGKSVGGASGLLSLSSGEATGTTQDSGALLIGTGKASGSSGAISITGGTGKGGDGGALTLTAGGVETNAHNGGNVAISSGSSAKSSSGAITIGSPDAGDAGAAVSGAITLSSGKGGTHASGGNSGDIELNTGTARATGQVSMTTGVSSAGVSGLIQLSTGKSVGGASGLLSLSSGEATGTGPTQDSGALLIGTGKASGSSGAISITGGEGTGGAGGALTLSAGKGNTAGGKLSLSGGDSANTKGNVEVDLFAYDNGMAEFIISGNSHQFLRVHHDTTQDIDIASKEGDVKIEGKTVNIITADNSDNDFINVVSEKLNVLADLRVTGGLTISGNVFIEDGGLTVENGITVTNNGITSTPGITTSDVRLKTDIIPLPSPLSKVSKLRGVYFSWVQDEPYGLKFDDRRHVGVLAQDVQEVLPETVDEIQGGKYLGVDYPALIPLLIEAIKELNTRTAAMSEFDKLMHMVIKHEEMINLINKRIGLLEARG